MKRLCPICGKHGELGRSYLDLESEKYGVSKELAVQNYICRSCDFSFFELVTGINDDSKELYYGLDFSPSGAKRRHYALTDFLIGFFKEKACAFVDIGGGNQDLEKLLSENFDGIVLDLFPKKMRSSKKVFLDLSDSASAELSLFSGKKIDLAVFDNVLEHMNSFSVVEKVLAEIGPQFVYVSVPNRRSLKYFFNKRSFYRPIEHVNNFSPKSIDLLMSNFGYTICRSFPKPKGKPSIFKVLFMLSMLGFSFLGIYRFYKLKPVL